MQNTLKVQKNMMHYYVYTPRKEFCPTLKEKRYSNETMNRVQEFAQ